MREEKPRRTEMEAAAKTIRNAMSIELGLVLGGVVLITPRSILKTTSGKLRRRECRAAYLQLTRRDTSSAVLIAPEKMLYHWSRNPTTGSTKGSMKDGYKVRPGSPSSLSLPSSHRLGATLKWHPL